MIVRNDDDANKYIKYIVDTFTEYKKNTTTYDNKLDKLHVALLCVELASEFYGGLMAKEDFKNVYIIKEAIRSDINKEFKMFNILEGLNKREACILKYLYLYEKQDEDSYPSYEDIINFDRINGRVINTIDESVYDKKEVRDVFYAAKSMKNIVLNTNHLELVRLSYLNMTNIISYRNLSVLYYSINADDEDINDYLDKNNLTRISVKKLITNKLEDIMLKIRKSSKTFEEVENYISKEISYNNDNFINVMSDIIGVKIHFNKRKHVIKLTDDLITDLCSDVLEFDYTYLDDILSNNLIDSPYFEINKIKAQ